MHVEAGEHLLGTLLVGFELSLGLLSVLCTFPNSLSDTVFTIMPYGTASHVFGGAPGPLCNRARA